MRSLFCYNGFMFDEHIYRTKPGRTCLLFIGILMIYGFGGAFLYDRYGRSVYTACIFLFALFCLFLFLRVRRGNRLLKKDVPVCVLSIVFLVIFIIGYVFTLFDVTGNIRAVLAQPLQSILINTFTALTAGIFEETVFRGYAADAFCAWYKKTKHPLCRSALWTSLIFGLMHLSNMNGTNTDEVLIQVFYACMLGLALYACRLLSNSLALPVLLHFLIDLQPDILTEDVASGPFSAYVITFLPLGILAFVTIYHTEKNCLKTIAL